MRDRGRCRRERTAVLRFEHRRATERHLPFRGAVRRQVELPHVAQQITRIGRRDHPIAVAQQLHAAQTIGRRLRTHPRVHFAQQPPVFQLHHEEPCRPALALVAIAEHRHPGAITQHPHLGRRQHMAQFFQGALVMLPHQRFRAQARIGRVRHVQGEHRCRPGPGGTQHHVLPAALEIRIRLHQRPIHQQPLVRNVPVGQTGHFLCHLMGHIGKALGPGLGIEGMHHALVAAHHHQPLAVGAAFRVLDVLTVQRTQRLAPRVGQVDGQCPIALTGGRPDEHRVRIDDLPQRTTTRVVLDRLVVAVTQQIGHQLPALGGLLGLGTRGHPHLRQQHVLHVLRQVVGFLLRPLQLLGLQPGGFPHDDIAPAPVRHLLGRAPLPHPFLAHGTDRIGLQIAGTAAGGERRHELLVAGLQRPAAHRHTGRGTRTIDDFRQNLAHRGQKLRAVVDVHVAAVAVDGGVPEVVHRGR